MIPSAQTIKEVGFDNYMEAYRCKTLADMPEEQFEDYIQNKIGNGVVNAYGF